MKSFKKFLVEKDFVPDLVKKKGSWAIIPTTTDKEDFAIDLIDLVNKAYVNTKRGSFVNSIKDVISSEWIAVDLPGDEGIDAAIFYRLPRSNEPWQGKKIQGFGHNGTEKSKKAVIEQHRKLLLRRGWWVEASAAMEHILHKQRVPYLDNEEKARKMFPKSDLKMTGDLGQYERTIPGTSQKLKETIFGNPII